MNVVSRLLAYIRSLWNRIASPATKDAQSVTVSVKVDAEAAFLTLEKLSRRVNTLQADIENAIAWSAHFETKAAAWAELKAKSAVEEVQDIAAAPIKLADHALVDVEAVYADGEKLAATVGEAIKIAHV